MREPRLNRSKLSTASAIDKSEVDRLREEDTAKEEKRQREAAKAAIGKSRETRIGRGPGASVGWAGGVA